MWISVDERLPESGDEVLCVCYDTISRECSFQIGRYDWFEERFDFCDVDLCVTYWQELPDMP